MKSDVEAVVENPFVANEPRAIDAGAERPGSSRRTVAVAVAVAGSWVIWLVCVTTAVGWLALALLPTSTRNDVLPWWFRVSSWVQVVTLVTVGRLIVSRSPRHVIGWCFVASGVLLTLDHGTRDLLQLQTVPLLPIVEWLVGTRWLWIPAVTLMTVVVPLTFPDGHPPSSRWRPVVAIAVIWIAGLTLARILRPGSLLDVRDHHNPLGIGGGVVTYMADHGLSLWPVFLLLSLGALLARFRSLDADDRHRSQWLILAMVVMIAFLAADKTFQTIAGREPPALFYLSAGTQVLVPLIAAVAILKFRLYGVEVVVQRALVYGALAVFISGVYVAVVGGLGATVSESGSTHRGLPLLATTVVALAFQPLRERLQRIANRLVYGKRATPYEVLTHFIDEMSTSIPDTEFFDRTARVVAQALGARSVEVWVGSEWALRHVASYPPTTTAVGDDPLTESGRSAAGGEIRTVKVRYAHELLGAIVVRKRPGDPIRGPEANLLDDVARQAGLVLANGRLATELSARLDELKASRARIVSATDAERQRIERDLHDGAQQRLVNASLLLGLLDAQQAESGAGASDPLMKEAKAEVATALAELRELARGIHPAILTEAGLGPAVRSLAERCRTPASVKDSPDRRLPQTVEVAAYFLVAEALTNVVKHACASSVDVHLIDEGNELLVRVVDDGVGGADPLGGSGLRGLVDRVGALNGSLVIRSAPGAGTAVEARLPCA